MPHEHVQFCREIGRANFYETDGSPKQLPKGTPISVFDSGRSYGAKVIDVIKDDENELWVQCTWDSSKVEDQRVGFVMRTAYVCVFMVRLAANTKCF